MLIFYEEFLITTKFLYFRYEMKREQTAAENSKENQQAKRSLDSQVNAANIKPKRKRTHLESEMDCETTELAQPLEEADELKMFHKISEMDEAKTTIDEKGSLNKQSTCNDQEPSPVSATDPDKHLCIRENYRSENKQVTNFSAYSSETSQKLDISGGLAEMGAMLSSVLQGSDTAEASSPAKQVILNSNINAMTVKANNICTNSLDVPTLQLSTALCETPVRKRYQTLTSREVTPNISNFDHDASESVLHFQNCPADQIFVKSKEHLKSDIPPRASQSKEDNLTFVGSPIFGSPVMSTKSTQQNLQIGNCMLNNLQKTPKRQLPDVESVPVVSHSAEHITLPLPLLSPEPVKSQQGHSTFQLLPIAPERVKTNLATLFPSMAGYIVSSFGAVANNFKTTKATVGELLPSYKQIDITACEFPSVQEKPLESNLPENISHSQCIVHHSPKPIHSTTPKCGHTVLDDARLPLRKRMLPRKEHKEKLMAAMTLMEIAGLDSP